MKCKRILTGLIGISMCAQMYTPVYADDETFSQFEEEMFVELMESDYTTMHYAVVDYASYGIEKPELTIGEAEWDYDEYVEEYEEELNTLYSFDYDSLSDTEKQDYDTIEFYLNSMIELNKYPYFDFKFHYSSGVLDALTTTFTEFVFYNKEDIDDYLTVLSTVPQYLDDCIEITKKQAEKGYFLTEAQLQDTEDLIDKFVEKTEDNELIVIFDENIDAFEGLSESEKEEYKARNKEIVLNSYIPSFQKVEDELEKLKGSRNGQYNVCSLEDGSAYYEALAKYKTSLDTDVQTMLELCTEFIDQSIEEMQQAYISNPTAFDEDIDLSGAEEILSYLENHMDNFPEIEKVNYTASYLDESVANDSIIAYYLTPPIDDTSDNVIKINGNNVSDTEELYTTLAHEGFPGHLYQTNYYLQSDPAPIRTQLTMMGYTEGWGMYASAQALEVSGMSEEGVAINVLNEELNYVLDAAVDLGVNGLGWGTSDIADYLEQLGFDSSQAKDLYDFVTSDPGTLLPYGVGVVMFELLEDKAQETLGSDFDQKEFNKVLLDGGSRPFATVEEDVNAYLGISNTDANNILSHTHESSSTESETNKKETTEKDKVNWIAYGGIGVGIAAVGAVALVLVIKSRRDNPFA